MTRSPLTRYKALFFIHGALMNSYFALWQPKLLERGFHLESLAGLLTLQTALSLALVLPTGALADRLGPKRLVYWGAFLMMAAFTVPTLFTSSLALVTCVLIIGISDACINGALDAMANQDLVKDEIELSDSYLNREQWAAAGRLVGALSIPAFASLVGESTRALWLPLALLSAGWVLLVRGMRKGATPTVPNGTSTWMTATDTLRSSLGALGSMAKEPLGMAVFMIAFCFGLSDGATGIAFRPHLLDLGVTSSWALGLVQAGLTASRLVGVTAYRTFTVQSPAKAGALALSASALFYWLYAVTSDPLLGVSFWLVRVALLAGYFPIIRTLVSKTRYAQHQSASALSALSVVTLLGSLVFSMLVASLPEELAPGPVRQLELGALASLLAGATFFFASAPGFATGKTASVTAD